MAVAFSEDDSMGDDFVTQCVFPAGGEPTAHFSLNVGKSNVPPNEEADKAAEEQNLKLVHAHKGEDGMYCHFRQKSTNGESKFAPVLDKDQHIFLARGKARDGRSLDIHSLDPTSVNFPYITNEKVNVMKRDAPAQAPTNASAAEEETADEPFISRDTKFWLIKVHGMLMIFAWMVLVASAVLSARYLRDHFSNSAPWGLKWWFHFGTIAILVAIIQPLLALMRCQPDTGARPIFNWTHRILGITGIVLAIVAILIAANSFVSLWSNPSWCVLVVIFYIVVVVLSVALFELLSYMKSKASSKTTAMEMRNRTSHRYDDSGRVVNSPAKIIHKKVVVRGEEKESI
ncbi:hypothetical protein ANCCEY_04518 [Ancylostoma ceylanicum]|uniref:Cytochrome b561 domain-containing protein n=1 Tax=Ancylostoma ceylanicum TaxID=53326 RepID=A0A0D6LYX7_9BILA|nr:hypothetical protein ANCCEY_04518 [Ancylostoma ceylanicum]